jgi:hypothetical protein
MRDLRSDQRRSMVRGEPPETRAEAHDWTGLGWLGDSGWAWKVPPDVRGTAPASTLGQYLYLQRRVACQPPQHRLPYPTDEAKRKRLGRSPVHHPPTTTTTTTTQLR